MFKPQELGLQVGAEKQCTLLKCEGGRVDTGSLSTHNQSEGSSVAGSACSSGVDSLLS